MSWDYEVMTSWCRGPNLTLWMRFTRCPNLMILASPWLKIDRFSNWSFCLLWAVQSRLSFCWLLASQNYPTGSFKWLWACHSYFTEFGQGIRLQEVIFNYSISWNQELKSPVNKETAKVQSFIPFCKTFFWFVQQNKIVTKITGNFV